MGGINIKRNPNVILPSELVESVDSINVLISPVNKEVGVVITLNNDKSKNKAFVTIYSIFLQTNEKYSIKDKLQTFQFKDQLFASKFYQHLPDMSALELILVMNEITEE